MVPMGSSPSVACQQAPPALEVPGGLVARVAKAAAAAWEASIPEAGAWGPVAMAVLVVMVEMGEMAAAAPWGQLRTFILEAVRP